MTDLYLSNFFSTEFILESLSVVKEVFTQYTLNPFDHTNTWIGGEVLLVVFISTFILSTWTLLPWTKPKWLAKSLFFIQLLVPILIIPGALLVQNFGAESTRDLAVLGMAWPLVLAALLGYSANAFVQFFVRGISYLINPRKSEIW